MSCAARRQHRLATERPANVVARRRDLGRRDAVGHRGRLARRERARAPAQGMAARGRQDAGRRHHRHGRRGQVERRRRIAAAFPARVPGHAHRRARGRSDAAPLRRRAARRSHPHELAALQARLHALDGDAPPARGDERRAEGLHRVPQGARLRPRHRRDGRHRPVRFGDRRSRRFPDVRDDERLRRGEPAREDRHARFRRARRAQQVRQARRRRCAARRAQAVEAQPHRVQAEGRRRSGLSDDREPVQRSRRDVDVRQSLPAAARQAASCRPRSGRPRSTRR